MNTELEEMREQLDLLKKKLEKQEIVNDRLISKIKESLEKDMATVRRQYRMGHIVNFLSAPLIYYIVVYQLGLSVIFGIATAIWAFVTFVFFFWRKGHLYNLHSDNLLEAQLKVTTLKQHHRKWLKFDYLSLAFWLAWLGWEIYRKCTMENAGDVPVRLYFGFVIGGLIGILINIWKVVKTQRRYQRMLDQIEDLKAESQ
ncbi:MAG: LapA family protein [Bacteroidaceae bacterium]|nr:LapA family protein [Bacteroidaceae bacterium]